MTKFKTVELLTRAAKGKHKAYPCSLADKLIKRGMAKPIGDEELAKYEAEQAAKAKEKEKQIAAAKKEAEKIAKAKAKAEKDALKKSK